MKKIRSSPAGEPGAPQGYTLVEMLVVIALLGLIIAAVPALMSAGRLGVQGKVAAQGLAADLREARIFAISNNRETDVLLDLSGKTYVVQPGMRPHKLPDVLALEFLDAEGIPLDGPAEFKFFPDGSSSGGQVKITARGEVHRIIVHALTGRTSVDE